MIDSLKIIFSIHKNPLRGISLFFFILPVCLFYPYHSAFFSLALFGVWHLFSEWNFWNDSEKILENRQKFSPLIISGVVVLTLWSLAGNFLGEFSFRKDSFYHPVYLTFLAVWVFVSSIKNSRKSARVFFILLISVISFSGFAWAHTPFAYFLLVHLHNVFPWIFLYRKIKEKKI